jgi:hypothetical protein
MNPYWLAAGEIEFLYWSDVLKEEFDYQTSFNAYWRKEEKIPGPSSPIYFGGTVKPNVTHTGFIASFDDDSFHGDFDSCKQYLISLNRQGQQLQAD